MPKKEMSEGMVRLLYDLAIDPLERQKFFKNAKRYLSAYLTKSKFDLSEDEQKLLINEAERTMEGHRIKEANRRKPGRFEDVYGKMFLPCTDNSHVKGKRTSKKTTKK